MVRSQFQFLQESFDEPPPTFFTLDILDKSGMIFQNSDQGWPRTQTQNILGLIETLAAAQVLYFSRFFLFHPYDSSIQGLSILLHKPARV